MIKQTATRPALNAKVKATVTTPLDTEQAMAADIEGLFKRYNLTMPSLSRTVISFIACAIAGGVIGYLGGVLLAITIAGVLTFTGSVLLAFLVEVLGILAIIVTAWFAGGYVGSFIMSGNIDRCYAKVSNKVAGWFSRKEITPDTPVKMPRQMRAFA